MGTTQEQLALARSAKKSINTASTALKNQALRPWLASFLKAIGSHFSSQSNRYGSSARKISEVMLDRLFRSRADCRDGTRNPCFNRPARSDWGSADTEVLENGLEIQKVRVAMGVIGIIYESRPNVTSDAAALAIKSGNAVVLRTGKDAFHSASSDRDSPQGWIGRSRTESRSSSTDPRYESSF